MRENMNHKNFEQGRFLRDNCLIFSIYVVFLAVEEVARRFLQKKIIEHILKIH